MFKARGTIRIIGIALLAAAALISLVALLPTSLLQSLISSIFHHAGRIRADRFAMYRSGLFLVAGYFGCAGASLWAAADSVRIGQLDLSGAYSSVRKAILHDKLPHPRLHYLLAFSVLVSGALIRASFLNQPIRTDEAASYLSFASRPLYVALADYSMPNNHLLNTLMMGISTRLFGLHEWSVRLPVLLLGILLLAAIYAAARALQGYRAGLLALSLAAASPRLVEYSINARGYMLISVATVLCLLFVKSALQSGRTGSEGMLIAFTCALGLCAVPTMLLSILGIYTWWFVCELRMRGAWRFSEFFHAMVFPGWLAGMAVVGFYIPALIYSGAAKVLNNRFVSPMGEGQFWNTAMVVVQNVWASWNKPIPRMVVYVVLAGAVFGLIQYRKSKSIPIPPLPVFVLAGAGFCLARQVVGTERVWLFWLPVYLITAAIGIDTVVGFLAGGSRDGIVAAIALTFFCISAVAVAQEGSECWTDQYGVVSNARQISDMLSSTIQKNDRISFGDDGYHCILFRATQYHPVLREVLLGQTSNPRRRFLIVGKFPTVEPPPERGCATPLDPESEQLRRQFLETGAGDPGLIRTVVARKIAKVRQDLLAGLDRDPSVLAFEGNEYGMARVFAALPGTTVFVRERIEPKLSLRVR